MGMLTVRENIAFSAALRLPSSVSNKEKTRRVSEIIEDFGLAKCADIKVRSCVFVNHGIPLIDNIKPFNTTASWLMALC